CPPVTAGADAGGVEGVGPGGRRKRRRQRKDQQKKACELGADVHVSPPSPVRTASKFPYRWWGMHSTLSGRDALDEPPGLHSKPGQNPMNLSGEFSRLVR